MEQWVAHFRDRQHNVITTIENNFQKGNTIHSLKMTVDNVTFTGMSFDDFELENEQDMVDTVNKFSIVKWGKNPNYYYALQRYSLLVEIPVQAIEIQDNLACTALIRFAFSFNEDTKKNSHDHLMLDDERVFPDIICCDSFSLIIGDKEYRCDNPSLDFETSLSEICRKIKSKYYLKCCFGCLYSDYSPYGNGCFATMLCFLNVADQYIHVSGKYGDNKGISIWEVHDNGEQKQETYVCENLSRE